MVPTTPEPQQDGFSAFMEAAFPIFFGLLGLAIVSVFVAIAVGAVRNNRAAKARGVDLTTLDTELRIQALQSRALGADRSIEQRLAEIDDLAARGVDVRFDMYPYTRGCTLVAMALLPPEYSARSIAEAVALLGDPDERARLRADWFPLITDKPSLGPAWPDMVVIAHAPRAPRAAGLSLRAEAARRGVDVVDATLDLLIENALEVSAVMAVRDERPTSNLARLFSHPAYTGGSDGIYIGDAPHPRGWGTFARLLGTYTREVGAFGWTQAVRRLAGLPAERYGLHDRGVLTPGRRGDVALVDPDTVADRATYAQRTALAIGIDDVVVAGVPVLAGGELTGATPGAAARRTGPARS